MKLLGRWTWQCNSCETVILENEWRTIDDLRELPRCEKCGASVWNVLKIDWCPEGCLRIEFGKDKKFDEKYSVESGEVAL